MISSAFSSNRSLMESRDSSASLSIFSSEKLIFSLISNQQLKILSELKTSLKLTRNLSPLICPYCEKRFSMVSLWNLAVLTNSHPSSINSSIKFAGARSVVTRDNLFEKSIWKMVMHTIAQSSQERFCKSPFYCHRK